jgi:Flp pilus assembly pilin Flp
MPVVFPLLSTAFKRFWRDEKGVLVAELALVLPVFVWSIIGMFTYWDAFKSLNMSQKAAYTVSDLIAREKKPVDSAYLNGMHDVMQYLVGNDLPVTMRITSITYSGVRSRFEVIWSRSPYSGTTALTTTTLQSFKDRIPAMSDGDSVVLVETWTDFEPAFQSYVGAQQFSDFIITRPRFVPKVCLKNVAC